MIHADPVCFNFERLFVPLKRVKIDVSANWPMKTSSHCPCVTAGEAGWTFLMQVSGAGCPSSGLFYSIRAKRIGSQLRVHCGMQRNSAAISGLCSAWRLRFNGIYSPSCSLMSSVGYCQWFNHYTAVLGLWLWEELKTRLHRVVPFSEVINHVNADADRMLKCFQRFLQYFNVSITLQSSLQ